MRHRLTLEKAARTADGAGGATLAWNAAATLWGEIVPVKAEERPRGEGLADMALCKITIRHRTDVAAGDRLRLGSRLFLILAVSDPAEDKRFLACLAEEGGAA
jgi:SPP1 family predicted phage head-tail adaptor